ncbi:MAG TPA: ATPase, T2SS/T4P/T4SS family, partial [Rhodocyclaceae bacterium]
MNAPSHRRPLGQVLISQGILSEDQLRIALLEQMKSNLPVGKLLVKLGFVSEATLREALSESLGTQGVDLTRAIVDPSALKLVPREIAKRHHLLPLDYNAGEHLFKLAVADHNDIIALDKVRSLLPEGTQIDTLLAGEGDIAKAIDQHYGYELSIDGILHEIETGEIDWSSLQSSSNEYSQPVVRLIDAILTDAVKRDASDIHFEPEQNFLRVRYRIDGILRQIRSLHKSYWPAMAVRIKVMSGMNIAESRAPQDGRINLTISGRQIDFRVAAQPTIHGENIVLRILDRQKGIVPLEALGLADDHLDLLKVMSGMNIAESRAPQDGRINLTISGRQIDFRVAAQPTIHGENIVLRILDRQKGIVPLEALGLADDHLDLLKVMIARPEGIILVTGPTGSGKTTTLYSILNHLNADSVNIMTLEDPVEYPMAMVRQTSIAETTKLDFADGIRSIMRQDPDIILVGEVRDNETAQMAFRASMTGHQVFSTLHTNSAIGAIPRLLDIGILP